MKFNKNWVKNWKKIVNYEKNSQILEKSKFFEKMELSERIDNAIGEIKNKEILIDINTFIKDGDDKNNENNILKENSYEKISGELWDSFKKYGYDIEINSEIINNNNWKK